MEAPFSGGGLDELTNYLIKSQKQELLRRNDLLKVLQSEAVTLGVKLATAMGI